MRTHRLKTYIWVQSKQRLCKQNNLPIYIIHKGERKAGAVIVKINLLDGRSRVFSQINNLDGGLTWQSLSTNNEPIPEKQANEYITKQRSIDPDLWIIEVEDTQGKFKLGEIL